METMSMGEAKSRFCELISRAVAGERFLIRRRNRPVAVLIGSTELERLHRERPSSYPCSRTTGSTLSVCQG